MDDERLERAQLQLGRLVAGKWRLDGVLGVGGMATVFSATHRNKSRVAIKMLHVELSASPEIKKRFLREGYAANAVESGGVARVLDDGEDEGQAFVVMELLEGESVGRRAEKQGDKLPVGDVLMIARGVLSVLVRAHEKGIVHRDIKPENVFLTTSNEVKLLDFGIARARDANASIITQGGGTMGTPAFMPPELALGQMDRVDGRSDLWAVGAMMFSLITGRTVHEAKTVNEHLVLAATKRAPSLASVAPGTPEKVVAIVDRALAFDPASRYQSAQEMLVDVRDVLGLSSSNVATSGRAFRTVVISQDSIGATHETVGVASDDLPAPRSRKVGLVVGGIALAFLAVAALTVPRLARKETSIAPAISSASAAAPSSVAPAPSPSIAPLVTENDHVDASPPTVRVRTTTTTPATTTTATTTTATATTATTTTTSRSAPAPSTTTTAVNPLDLR